MTIPKNTILPHVRLYGSPAEIGYQHGKLLKTRIQEGFHFYSETLFQSPGLDLKGYGKRYLQVIGNFAAGYGEEIEAIARGSHMEAWQIAVLNARSEIFVLANVDLIKECTALYFREKCLLGQNWDWMMPCEAWMVLLEIERPDGHKLLTLTEPGIIGKIGMNSSGLGVCLNILFGEEGTPAVPVHILLRAVLDEASLDEACKMLQCAPFNCFSNLLIAGDRGLYADMELAGESIKEVSYEDGIPMHTNHYLSEPRDRPGLEHVANSKARLSRARELGETIVEQNIEEMKRILLDRKNGEDAICKASAPLWGTHHGTICSLVMDLPGRVMHITRGNPYHATFEDYHLT